MGAKIFPFNILLSKLKEIRNTCSKDFDTILSVIYIFFSILPLFQDFSNTFLQFYFFANKNTGIFMFFCFSY